jgi:hypothetical protein
VSLKALLPTFVANDKSRSPASAQREAKSHLNSEPMADAGQAHRGLRSKMKYPIKNRFRHAGSSPLGAQ